MTTLRLDDLRQYSDVLRSRQRRGGDRALRRAARCRGAAELFPLAHDPLPLQPLPRRRSANCRRSLLEDFIHVGEADRFSVVATMLVDGLETIVGEARYAFDSRHRQHRVRPVDRRPLAGPRHRQGAAEKSRMPRGGVRRRAPVRRHAALQRRHDRARPQVRLRLHQYARRLEAGALPESRSMSNRRKFPAPAGGSPPSLPAHMSSLAV